MGFANSPATRNALAPYGIRVGGYRWRWALGLKGGTYPPHYHQNGEFAADAGDFDALPGEDLNGDSCACNLIPVYRDAAGRFAKPGLEPVFQPPATASLTTIPGVGYYQPEPFDWTPLTAAVEALAVDRPLSVSVTIPDGAIVVNVPQQAIPAPVVNMEPTVVPAPVVNVENTIQPAPLTVETPVTVEAPNVTVQPRIEVKPAPVKIVREKVAKAVRFRRNSSGLIESAEVTE